MKILALDTSTEACSAALWHDGEVFFRYQIAPRQHAQLILEMLDELLGQAGFSLSSMDAVAYGRGPGAFTGVRIAAAVTQGMAYSVDLPVVPVSSLAAMAHGVWREKGQQHVLTAIDARIQEVYWSAFHIGTEGDASMQVAEAVVAPEQVRLPGAGNDWYGAGTGFATYEQELLHACQDRLAGYDSRHYPHARDIAALAASQVKQGNVVTAQDAIPVYLRDKVAEKARPA
jgi:tRNA threonylcarbamoyladenosine biosynthesis protein TsaB